MLTINISIGEAIDRLIILALKLKAVPDNNLIQEEHAKLQLQVAVYQRERKPRHYNADILLCWDELEVLHRKLWALEDRKRQLMAVLFAGGHTVVDLATMNVYELSQVAVDIAKFNDRRSVLKQLLNKYYEEPQTEVKVFNKEEPCPPPSETPTSST